MTITSPRKTTVAIVVTALVSSLALAILPASPTPVLPRVRPSRLLASTIASLQEPRSLSGKVAVTINLGSEGVALPHDQTHHVLVDRRLFRIWRSSSGLRVAQVLRYGERLFVANQHEAWWWDSQTMRATHLDASEVSDEAFDFTPALAGDPLSLARTLLDTVRSRAEVSVDGTGVVAGRSTYVMTVRSTMRRSRLRKVVVWVDSRTRLPLRIQLWSRALGEPAVDAAFTRISFGGVDPALFEFSPPDGTNEEALDVFRGRRPRSLVDEVRTFGASWRTRVAFHLPRRLTDRVEDLFPLWASIGAVTTVRDHGRSWVLAGFVSLRRLEKDIPQLT